MEGQQALVDRPLAQLGLKRRVALSLPFFVPAIFAIARSDLIVAVPRKLAKITAAMAGVRVVDPPARSKPFPISWRGTPDSLLILRMPGFANNYGCPLGQFE